MISALAGSHILHINSASVCELLSQPNRPTSTVTNSTLVRARWSDGKHSASSRARHTGGRETTQAPSQSSWGSRFSQCCVQTGTTKEECKWGHYSLFRAGTLPSPPPPLGQACHRSRKASDESRVTLEAWSHGKADSCLLLRILQAQHFLAHRTAELFTSFLTKHWSSSSIYTKGAYTQSTHTPSQSRLAALFLGIAKVLCLRPSSRGEAGEGGRGKKEMISLLGQRLTSKS